MSEQNLAEARDYTGFEYKQVTARNEMESLWVDSMTHFGWKPEKSRPKLVKRLPFALWIMAAPLSLLPWRPFQKSLDDHESADQVELTFKRERNIGHKQELNQLQAQFERSVQAIDSLEESRGTSASIAGWLIGLLGAALLGVATFAYLDGMTPLFLLPAVPGFLCWLLSYVIYRSMKSKREQAIAPKIEEQHENIYKLCQAGNSLLRTA